MKPLNQKAKQSSRREHASGAFTSWNSICWPTVQKKVWLMQTRIVEAQSKKQWRKVKALQHLLTHSFYAKLLAVKRVTSAKGKYTPGIDGVCWKTTQQKWNAALQLSARGYKAKPLKRVYIPKANGKKRPLSIPCMIDRAMQALYLLALIPVAEATADQNSYGFRPKRGCHDALEQCFIVLSRGYSPVWILDADIKACFDTISHQWILEHVPLSKWMLGQWLKTGVVDGKDFFCLKEGTPQGGVISPTIANMVLDGMEKQLNLLVKKRFDKHGKLDHNPLKVNMVRYADDFIVTAKDKSTLTDLVIPFLENFLKERGLKLSEEKTRIVHIEEGFDFLGKTLRKFKGRLFIKPSKGNISSCKTKIRTIFSKHKARHARELIVKLNPLIRGWANYHRHTTSKLSFANLDNFVFLKLWRWAKRRHSRKGGKWIKHRYFVSKGFRRWEFCDDIKAPSLFLLKAQSIPIVRYIKVTNAARLFDKQWRDYFDKRAQYKLHGRSAPAWA
jgi:RNA-directed DNA polymerase